MSATTLDQAHEAAPEEVVDAVGAAVALAAGFRARACTAEAKRDVDALEATRLEESAGAELLDDDDPDAGDRLAARLATLRASVDMQARVASEALARACAADAAALRAEADLLEPAIVEAAAALEVFDAKTDRLSAALAKHVGGKVRILMPDEEAAEAFRAGTSSRIEYATPPRWALARAVAELETRRDLARGLADVMAGARSLSDVRQEVTAGHDAVFGGGVQSEHLPALVRDRVVVVPGLELWLTIPVKEGPRDWQGEYDQERADLQAARDRLAAAEAGRASGDIRVRREALAVDQYAVEATLAHHEGRMRSLAEQAEALGVSVN